MSMNRLTLGGVRKFCVGVRENANLAPESKPVLFLRLQTTLSRPAFWGWIYTPTHRKWSPRIRHIPVDDPLRGRQ